MKADCCSSQAMQSILRQVENRAANSPCSFISGVDGILIEGRIDDAGILE
jgi:hypothetical protein